MKSQSDAENHKKSRLIAEKVDCRDISQQMPNIAICRGKRQPSRFRTHRDKRLPLLTAHSLMLDYLGLINFDIFIFASDNKKEIKTSLNDN